MSEPDLPPEPGLLRYRVELSLDQVLDTSCACRLRLERLRHQLATLTPLVLGDHWEQEVKRLEELLELLKGPLPVVFHLTTPPEEEEEPWTTST